MQKLLSVGLVGCGAVAERFYAPALLGLAREFELNVAALFDPNSNRTAKLQHFFPASAAVATFAEFVALRPDLAIVASPPRHHAEQTCALLRAGSGVLCEKPMAVTVVEAEQMLAAARESRSVLAVGLFRRFFPATQTIAHILRTRRFGGVKSFSLAEGSTFSWP